MSTTGFLNAWGTYERGGDVFDVGMGGTPASVNQHGLNMAQAHAIGRGRGIRFTSLNDEGTSVNVELSLIGYTLDNTNAIANGYYIRNGRPYVWYVDFQISYDGGNSYEPYDMDKEIASHHWEQNLAYADSSLHTPNSGGWETSTIEWDSLLNLPDTYTHLMVEVRSERPLPERYRNIYTREQVMRIVTYKPMAIRKSGTFRSLNRDSGFLMIRKSGSWNDISEMEIDDVGNTGTGAHRIRQSGQWVQQGIIGNET